MSLIIVRDNFSISSYLTNCLHIMVWFDEITLYRFALYIVLV